MEALIDENFSYKAKLKSTSIEEYKSCLENYRNNFDGAKDLKGGIPIFLDTNVLLRYYSISFTAREKLLNFIDENKERIYITSQVQIEFLKNREEVIQKFFDQVTNRIPKDFTSEIINKITNFSEQHKIVLKDYSFVEPELDRLKSEFENLLVKLNESIDVNKVENQNLLINDKLLEIICSCHQTDKLNENELKLIIDDYDELVKNSKKDNNNEYINKSVFPGLGDFKEKPDDPYGDFIIFHEILKFTRSKSQNVIFLTFDNTKGDWMKKDKSPHMHYIDNVYKNTDRILYIIDAERTLNKLLEVNIDSLILNDNRFFETELNINSLKKLFETEIILSKFNDALFDQDLIDELKFHGYETIENIVKDLKYAAFGFNKSIHNQKIRLNKVGAIRLLLMIANEKYNIIFSKKHGPVSPGPILLKLSKNGREFIK
ncbi:DUF4935 domain-containing protein [Flavobacterium salilacus subsp. salilacus]|uniref:PIN-like domain-containing protein n=1 Tax=Flavobacterium TaxID=237 RepID=UPI001074EAC6|nr:MULTISPECIES: PIN-like domain-containing protein [Flavobacterium]KAF2516282.1 DUF4935 domain-containing protein [Flavobacterium salilacus subsp. salilacus]MBE1613812.1 DUF4935 domain-containing protein [Flavobacterium sp. SaA2.13]